MDETRPTQISESDRDQVPPKLSVVVTSYNHEVYIRQCLDSYLAQQVDFALEIIVADDASADSTPTIITEYAARHPDTVKAILRPENLGLNANLGGALLEARGEYLTLCDADDYVTDPQKLARQIAHLDAHPETAVNFHPVQVLWEDEPGEGTVFPPVAWRDDLSVLGLVAKNFIQVNAAVYRRLPSYVDALPLDLMPQDWYLHLLHAKEGTISMLPETMSVYRRHAQGMFALSHSDPDRFWARHGKGHAAFAEAVLDLFPGDAEVEKNLASLTARIFGGLAVLAHDTERAESERSLLASTARAHPRAALLGMSGQQIRYLETAEALTEARALVKQREVEASSAAAAAAKAIGKRNERIAEQREVVLKQRARIKKLRRRVEVQNAEIQEARAAKERTLRFRASRLVARVRPGRAEPEA